MSSVGHCAAPCGPAKIAAPYSWLLQLLSIKSASFRKEQGIPTESGMQSAWYTADVYVCREITAYLGDELRIFDCDDFNSILLTQSSAG